MADLPLEGRTVEKKEEPLTQEQQNEAFRADIQELARGINVHGKLLEAIVLASDHISKTYLKLVTPNEKKEEPKEV